MTIRFFYRTEIPPSRRKPSLFKKALSKLIREPGELNVIFVGDQEIKSLHRKFFQDPSLTDVIAFQYSGLKPRVQGSRSGLRLGAARTGSNPQEQPLGDIFICVPQARRQAGDLGHSLLKELLTLAIHGTLHLLGEKDDTEKNRKKMFEKQDSILKSLSV